MTNTANTEEIKRLAEIINNAVALHGSYGFSEPIMNYVAKEILKHYLPSSALVRPLVWEELPLQTDRTWFANTPTGLYRTYKVIYLRDGYHPVGAYFATHFDTLKEAQDVCQRHFNTLIGSCLQGGGDDANTEWHLDRIKKIQEALTADSGDITARVMLRQTGSIYKDDHYVIPEKDLMEWFKCGLHMRTYTEFDTM